MPIYLNLLILAFFGIVAVAAGSATSTHAVPDSYLVGGFVLIAGGLFYTLLARFWAGRGTSAEFERLKRTIHEIKLDLDALRHGIVRVHDAVQTSGGSPAKTGGRDVSEIVSEVRVLQSLVEKLHASRNQEKGAVTPAPAAEVAVSEVAVAATVRTAPARPAATVATGLDESQILEFVREGLKADRVDLYLQPVVSLPQRKRRFYECYSRIRAEDGTVITPEQFLEIAAREGLIGAVDNMLLFRCVQLVRKARTRHREVGFFCNISPNNLNDRTFFTDFVEFMTQNAELAPHLFFEFGQADVNRFDAATLRQLGFLANYGFRFSLDRVSDLRLDLRTLRERGFNFVKLDTALVLKSIRGEKPTLDLRALKGALDRTGLDLIVEKVENEQSLVELLDYQLDYAQGFLFGEPRPSPEI
ncbi:MAG TPA: EAL domain-containing protein [Alphaproteobacteria bacterium]|nr:EAL domain-containing protein [Alphaproteobacteria bacterium]